MGGPFFCGIAPMGNAILEIDNWFGRFFGGMAMLESIDLKKRLKKEDYEREKKRLADELMCLQQQCVSEKLPVVICVDGWGASGKGTTIS